MSFCKPDDGGTGLSKPGGIDRSLDGAGERGMIPLTLKLPARRGKLKILKAKSGPLNGLFEAYEDASVTFRLRHEQREDDEPILRE
jgi:hypothetical protein